VFLFLNSWRSTVITGLTLPISVISSFIVMNFAGMTLNVMTLMALSLAIGLLIDDAIVVRENIVRHLERGEDHFTAARNGTAEIGLAVLATSLSIIAVFVPVAFMKGIIGRFFFQFGITVAFAVLVSLFVSFTLDPMLSSRWYDPDIERGGRRSWIARRLDTFNNWFDRSADRYKSVIGWALRHRPSVIGLAFLAFVLGIFCFFSLETEFFPRFDAGEFQVRFTSAPDASIAETEMRTAQVQQFLHSMPEVGRTYTTIGAGDAGTVRDTRIYVKLKDKKERTRTQTEVQRAVREALGKIPGIVPSVEDQTDQFSQKPVQILVRGEDIAKLKQYAAELKRAMYDIPGLVDLEVTLEQDVPEYRLTVDRDRALTSGVMTADIARSVGALVGGQAVSTYEDQDGDAIDVRVRLPEKMRQDVEQVRNLRLAVHRAGSATPTLVPLGELVHYGMATTPSEIDRRDLRRQVVISANLQNVALGTAIGNILTYANTKMTLAPGYSVYAAGDAEAMMESFGYMVEALIMAVIFVYLILAAQFQSFIDPLSIMLSLPLSIVGMAGTLLLTHDTVNMMSLIGLIMLMGLVTKNAILLVDFAKVQRANGMDRTTALITAGRTRLRPIMMTTSAMIFGMLPLALAIGAGAEMRAPMARAVIGGLITSTLLTLLVVPVVYSVLDDVSAFVRRHFGSRHPVVEPTVAEPIGEGQA
jgi:hydrophobic/amphiphilic exporter-1 (mainly G- bacteria), HAE1 family